MRNTAEKIIKAAIKAADPYINTVRILSQITVEGRLTVLSVGKAAVPMAKAAEDVFRERISKGLLVTKYHHSEGFSSGLFEVIESGHPISDNNSIKAAEKGLEAVASLGANDTLVVLLSGGGSSLFEKSRVSPPLQRDITQKLLSRGADITEINAVRKKLSFVKGGLLADAAYPAKVITVALSDVLGNEPSVIASGPTVFPCDSDEFILGVTDKYLYDIPENVKNILTQKHEIQINDGGFYFAGDINLLCDAALKCAGEYGFTVHSMQRNISGEASEEAQRILDMIPAERGKHCYIFGGECVVTLKGNGKGGRNQEAALKAAICLNGKKGITFASAGSDGTDGPTSAAGGIVDGMSFSEMSSLGIDPVKELENNNSNYALGISGGLLITGPTGTNVNDIIVVLTDNYEN